MLEDCMSCSICDLIIMTQKHENEKNFVEEVVWRMG